MLKAAICFCKMFHHIFLTDGFWTCRWYYLDTFFWSCLNGQNLYEKLNYIFMRLVALTESYTAWKVSKYGVFSGPYFPAFRTLFTQCYLENCFKKISDPILILKFIISKSLYLDSKSFRFNFLSLNIMISICFCEFSITCIDCRYFCNTFY